MDFFEKCSPKTRNPNSADEKKSGDYIRIPGSSSIARPSNNTNSSSDNPNELENADGDDDEGGGGGVGEGGSRRMMDLPTQEEIKDINTQKSIGSSCARCYFSRRKCDKKRPCDRCVRLGRTNECVDRQPYTMLNAPPVAAVASTSTNSVTTTPSPPPPQLDYFRTCPRLRLDGRLIYQNIYTQFTNRSPFKNIEMLLETPYEKLLLCLQILSLQIEEESIIDMLFDQLVNFSSNWIENHDIRQLSVTKLEKIRSICKQGFIHNQSTLEIEKSGESPRLVGGDCSRITQATVEYYMKDYDFQCFHPCPWSRPAILLFVLYPDQSITSLFTPSFSFYRISTPALFMNAQAEQLFGYSSSDAFCSSLFASGDRFRSSRLPHQEEDGSLVPRSLSSSSSSTTAPDIFHLIDCRDWSLFSTAIVDHLFESRDRVYYPIRFHSRLGNSFRCFTSLKVITTPSTITESTVHDNLEDSDILIKTEHEFSIQYLMIACVPMSEYSVAS